MATQDAPQDTTLPASKYPQMSGMVSILAPPLKEGTEETDSPKLDLEARSIKNADQAWELCKSTESVNKARSMRATVIELEYSGQPPFSAGEQQMKAQSWQSNVCTGILGGVTDRKVLRFVNAITSQVYLTRSSLPTTWPDWKKKSDLFAIHTTRLIQGWSGYSTFVNMLAKEDVLHGYAFAVFLDPYTWTPKCFKQEIAYVPEEAPQHSKELQFFMIKQDYLLHEFIDLFKDEQAAEDIGYNIKNCTEAANNSEVKNPREDAVVTEFRKFAEFIQDGVLGMTYATSGARVVKTYLLWNREYDGKVSFWILSRDNGKILRFASKIYDSMEEVVTLFSFQPGNSHLHSSKGVGRLIIGNVKIAEKLRNKMFDNVHISSMIFLRMNSRDRNKMQPVQTAPFIILDKEIEIDQTKLDANWDQYMALDQRVLNFMEQAAGVWFTANPNESSQPQTATGESIDAKREQENQDMTESRWKDQFSGMIQEMQSRAFADDHIDEAEEIYAKIIAGQPETEKLYKDTKNDSRCVHCIVDMFKDGLSRDEIEILRHQPSSGYAHTDDAITANGILAIKAKFSGNPNIDQVELDKRSVEALAGPDAAKALVLENPDQTVASEAQSKQLSESATMSTLKMPVPVSPRDNHMIHAQVLMGLLQVLGAALSSGVTSQEALKNLELNINHLGQHLDAYLGQGGVSQNPQFKQANDFYKKIKIDFEKAINVIEHAKMAANMPTPEGAQSVMNQASSVPVGQKNQGGGAIQGTVAGGSTPAALEQPMNATAIHEAPTPNEALSNR